MGGVGFEIAVIVLLVLANGAFALSEIAVVSARKVRLQQRAAAGDRRAAAALDLIAAPADFLATVQIGITLVGVFAGAYGGATLAAPFAAWLRTLGFPERWSEPTAFAAVVVAITFVSLVLGELVPKRLALQNAERLAALVARPMRLIAVAATPLVRLLSGASSLVLRGLHARPVEEPPVTEDEIKLLLAQGTQAGMFELAEREIVERVFRLADRRVASLMTPRPKVAWLDVTGSDDEIRQTALESPYSRLVVAESNLDGWLGYVRVRDLLADGVAGRAIDPRARLRQPLLVPESARALPLLERFKTSGTHIALVIDEYGGIDGLVTLNDLLEAVFGDMPAPGGEVEQAVRRDDGSWLVPGSISVEELKALLGIGRLPGEERGTFRTLGGFVMQRLRRVPREGDNFAWAGLRFEVVDMDAHSVDKVLVSAEPTLETPEDA